MQKYNKQYAVRSRIDVYKRQVYARNRIRLELLPFLEENYNENIQGVLLRLGRIAAEDKEYIWQRCV